MVEGGLITAFYPLYITQFLMGYAPFKLSKNNNNLLIKKLYSGFALTMILLLIISYYVYRHHKVVYHPDVNESALMNFINIAYFTNVLGFTLVSYLWSAIQRNSSLKLWMKIIKIDKDLKAAGIQLNYCYLSWSSWRFLLLSLISLHTYILYLLLSQDFSYPLQASISYALLYFGVLNHSAVICSFVTLIRFVNHILEVIIKKIHSIVAYSEGPHQHTRLRNVMCVYHTLYGILKLVNRAFSAQLVVSFGITFVLLTFQSYNVICSFYNRSPYLKYAVAGAVFVLTGVFEKFVIVLVCHKSVEQTKVLKSVLNRCMAETTNKSINKELNAFALQLLHETFEIYAGNMFLIDLPIFTSVCGTATTYIILLWQTDNGVDLNYSMKKVFGVF